MWWGHGWDGANWLVMMFGMLLMLLFWGGLIVLGFFAVRALLRSGSGASRSGDYEPGARGDRALEVLKERYARGEISREQYEEMREELRR